MVDSFTHVKSSHESSISVQQDHGEKTYQGRGSLQVLEKDRHTLAHAIILVDLWHMVLYQHLAQARNLLILFV